MRSFLGLVNYYSGFIQYCSAIAAPLTDLTRKSESDIIRWTSECQAAFDYLKQAMASAPVLKPPDYNFPFILQTDASDKGVGAVLSQIEHEKDHPFSKKILVRERKFSTTEKELLAIVMACKKFYPYLVGRRFTVESDHRALQYILQKEPATARNGYLDFEINYKPG